MKYNEEVDRLAKNAFGRKEIEMEIIAGKRGADMIEFTEKVMH